MTNVIATGVTGKSGRFFYKELRSNADKLTDYAFYFIVRDREKAERLLTAENLNQTICVGSAADTEFVSSVFEHIGGGDDNPLAYCQHYAFGETGRSGRQV